MENCIMQNGVLMKYQGTDEVCRVPEGTVSIQDEAFEGCENLKEIHLPLSIRKIPALPEEYSVSCFFEMGNQELLGCQMLSEGMMLKASEQTVTVFLTRIPLGALAAFMEMEEQTGRLIEEFLHIYSSSPDSISADILPEDKKFIEQNWKKSYLEMRDPLELFRYLIAENLLQKEDVSKIVRKISRKRTAKACQLLLDFEAQAASQTDTADQLDRRMQWELTGALAEEEARKDWDFCILDDQSIRLSCYKGWGEYVSIPKKIGTHPVSEIGTWTFRGNSILKGVIIPKGIQTVRQEAFYHCKHLGQVMFLSGDTRMEDFLSCCDEDAAVYAPKDSEAEQYAKTHGIPFQFLPA